MKLVSLFTVAASAAAALLLGSQSRLIQGPVPEANSGTLRVAVVGQALIRSDLRKAAATAVEQARRYLAGADVRFTNLEAAIAFPPSSGNAAARGRANRS